jgi:hypothetical protein
MFFRDSDHLLRYRDLANSANTNDNISLSKGYPKSHSTTVGAWDSLQSKHWHAHMLTRAHKPKWVYNHPHTPITAHNLCNITDHWFLYKLYAFVGLCGWL